jgi:hypothetical protein
MIIMMNEIIISLSYTKSHRHFGLPSKMYKNIIYGVGGYILVFSSSSITPKYKKVEFEKVAPQTFMTKVTKGVKETS